MKPGRPLALVAAVALAAPVAATAGCGSAHSPHASKKTRGAIFGAGATFPQPLYKLWGKRFEAQTGITVNYDPVGSGGGIAQFVARIVDFSATDVPMNAFELRAAAKKGVTVHVPAVLGAVALVYNVPGLGPGLRLDGRTAAALFQGRIARWDDRRIRALNPRRRLPALPVTVVHRSDQSGTTALFTQYLAASSPEWARRLGAGKAVAWPAGEGAARNAGVATVVAQRAGAVGYVELDYAARNGLPSARLRNRAGAYVAPTIASTAAAAGGLPLPSDLRLATVDRSAGPAAYPIASPTFLLVYHDMCKAGSSRRTAQLVAAWLRYVLGDGQALAADLLYAPLPSGLRAAARAQVAALRCDGSPLKPRT
jgi:phosphate transport system substrate-binding protein